MNNIYDLLDEMLAGFDDTQIKPKKHRAKSPVFTCEGCGTKTRYQNVGGRILCATCAEDLRQKTFKEVVFIDEQKGPECSLFDNQIYAHGVWAFRRTGEYSKINIFDCMARVNYIHNNSVQLSASMKFEPLGVLGVYVQGKVLFASQHDLGTEISKGGRRTTWRSNTSWAINKFEGLGYEKNSPWHIKEQHSEIVLQSKKIKGLWVRGDASEEIIKAWQNLANRLGVKCFILRGKQRVKLAHAE